jgi:hypothetical protein
MIDGGLAVQQDVNANWGYAHIFQVRDTIRNSRRLSRGVRALQHRARVTVTPDRHDFSIGNVNMLGEGNEAEDSVDIYDSDAVLAIDNKANYVDALHDLGKLFESVPKRSCATIRVRWELADRIWMERKGGSVVTPHRIDVPFDYLNHLLAHSRRSYHVEVLSG